MENNEAGFILVGPWKVVASLEGTDTLKLKAFYRQPKEDAANEDEGALGFFEKIEPPNKRTRTQQANQYSRNGLLRVVEDCLAPEMIGYSGLEFHSNSQVDRKRKRSQENENNQPAHLAEPAHDQIDQPPPQDTQQIHEGNEEEIQLNSKKRRKLNRQKERQNSAILWLPPEVLCHVFSFLSPTELVQLEMVCNRFKRILSDNGK